MKTRIPIRPDRKEINTVTKAITDMHEALYGIIDRSLDAILPIPRARNAPMPAAASADAQRRMDPLKSSPGMSSTTAATAPLRAFPIVAVVMIDMMKFTVPMPPTKKRYSAGRSDGSKRVDSIAAWAVPTPGRKATIQPEKTEQATRMHCLLAGIDTFSVTYWGGMAVDSLSERIRVDAPKRPESIGRRGSLMLNLIRTRYPSSPASRTIMEALILFVQPFSLIISKTVTAMMIHDIRGLRTTSREGITRKSRGDTMTETMAETTAPAVASLTAS